MKRRGNAGPDTKTKGSKAGGGASPSAHREAIARIEANAARAGVTLPKGATEAAISAAEAKMGVRFPAGMRAFYLEIKALFVSILGFSFFIGLFYLLYIGFNNEK